MSLSSSSHQRYCVTPSVSSDDGSSLGGSSAPPSPRSIRRTAAAVDAADVQTSSSSLGSMPSHVASSSAVGQSLVSLETLMHEKRMMLASFEAKFNNKILARHTELLEEQRRSLEADAADEVNRLKQEVERLKDNLEEHKFSHEVELTLQKKKVAQLEAEKSDATRMNSGEERRIKELEQELRKEKRLRIDQLKSLEQLHFAEFRQIERKHAESVSHLVATYRKEMEVLKVKASDNIANRGEHSSGRQPSSETAAAAAALSSLAAPITAGRSCSLSSIDVEILALKAVIQRQKEENKVTNITMPGPKKRNLSIVSQSSSVLRSDVSEMSDSGSSTNGDSDVMDRPAKKARISRQHKQVEDILKKAGKRMPLLASDPSSPKQNASSKEKKTMTRKTRDYLKAWMMSPEHCDHPYPNPAEKAAIMADTGVSFQELNTWFVNNRKRFWLLEVKPRIEEIKKAQRMKSMEESSKSCCAGT